MALKTLVILAAASLASAHFGIEYPPMRANTLGSSRNNSYSQYTNPCAGVPGNLTNAPRTPWPLTGGSLKLDLHHPWTYIFVNLGLGENVANFNYTLTNPFWNETGNGTLCVSHLALPADLPVRDGSSASLQVVTVGDDGTALYNCADITFSASAQELSADDCVNSPNVSFAPVPVQGQNQSSGSGSGSGSGGTNAGPASGVSVAALSSAVGLAMVFVFGMSL